MFPSIFDKRVHYRPVECQGVRDFRRLVFTDSDLKAMAGVSGTEQASSELNILRGIWVELVAKTAPIQPDLFGEQRASLLRMSCEQRGVNCD
jgi:hypothetical protein